MIVVFGCMFVAGVRLGGPLSSGALFLLLPSTVRPIPHDLPPEYKALHKGHVTLELGRYVREDEDLIVRGSPPLILRRTYLSGDHVSRQFGVGATHDGEWYLIGDPARFQWAALIRPDGSRATFSRTSPGTSFVNAMFLDTRPDDGWTGARLGWTGFGWALRRPDGSLFRFRGCAVGYGGCSIVSARDPDGHEIAYRRDAGRLIRIEADRRWIAFDYDAHGRVARAYDSAGGEVRYGYDMRGRLATVGAGAGVNRVYTYTDADEMATIDEPGWRIENFFEGGRCIRQVTHLDGRSDPYVFRFSYRTEGTHVVEASSRQSSGDWSRYLFDAHMRTTEEWHGIEDGRELHLRYERDPATDRITHLTLTCPDRSGQPATHANFVNNHGVEWLKDDMLRTYCR